MEQIYMIPVNEAFDECAKAEVCQCPICKMYEKLENKEVELALGPAMMEPATRQETNEKGFCHHHFEMMLERPNKLSLALILESHLDTIRGKMKGNALKNIIIPKHKSQIKATKALGESCYICEKIDYHINRMIETTVYLHSYDAEFRAKAKKQKYFCLPHYQQMVEYAKNKLDKKKFEEFYSDVSLIQEKYFDKIIKDVSWFCKKFDYRYDSEPWYDSKDACERAVRLLSSNTGKK